MNLRKFYFILTIVLSSVLFIAGVGVLYYVNSQLKSTSGDLSTSPIGQIFQPFMEYKEPFNVLLLGGDKVNKNSDTIMLCNFDPVNNKVTIMSIPRDTKVRIEGKTHKINYAYPHGGIDLTVKTVSELLDVNIKYYAFVDTSAFRNIIDLLGGVDYYVPVDMNYDDPTQNLHIHLKKGQQTLNGIQAEQYVRFRHPNRRNWTHEVKQYYDGGDIKRTEAQQSFVKELIRQKVNIQYLPKLNSVINVVFENVETNLTLNEVIRMTGYVSKFKMENLSFISLPGKPYGASPWYYLCDVESARQIVAEDFKCSSSYVETDAEVKEGYGNSSSDTENTTKTVKTTTKKPRKNPSNSESSMKGTNKANP